MKLKISAFIFLVTFSFSISDAQMTDSIEVKANYGSKLEDVKLLMELDHIDYYKVQFKNTTPKKLFLFLTTKEYWKGKVTKLDTILPLEDAKENFVVSKNDSSNILTLLTKPNKDNILFDFRFLGMSFPRKYKRIVSDEYSLRDGLVTNEVFKKIPIDKTIPLFVYSLPYEDPKNPGYLYYCALTANGVPPEKWWIKYKVTHYIVVEMKILPQ